MKESAWAAKLNWQSSTVQELGIHSTNACFQYASDLPVKGYRNISVTYQKFHCKTISYSASIGFYITHSVGLTCVSLDYFPGWKGSNLQAVRHRGGFPALWTHLKDGR